MSIILDPKVQLERARKILRAGEPVALPTETVYGLGANAWNAAALARIFQLKARPTFDPLIVHVLGAERLANVATFQFEIERRLAELFWPGPLTLLLKKRPRVPDLCTAGLETVAVRSPRHPVFRELLAGLDFPLAAPSANRFGRLSPTRTRDVVAELGPFGLEAVVEGGACELGVESTIVRAESETRLRILRPGALSLDELREKLGPAVEITVETSRADPAKAALAPGTLESHYAPRSPLCFVESERLPAGVASETTALLSFSRELPAAFRNVRWLKHEVLSEKASDREAAAALFQVLRRLDGAQTIVALRVPERGLGLAINDRLRRAGAGFGKES